MHNISEMAGLLILPFFIYLGVVNLFSFAIFGWDKYKSIKNGWRIPEKTLLLLAVLGGSPAMLIGQNLLRHKTRKQPFNAYLLLIVLIQIIAIAVLAKFAADY